MIEPIVLYIKNSLSVVAVSGARPGPGIATLSRPGHWAATILAWVYVGMGDDVMTFLALTGRYRDAEN